MNILIADDEELIRFDIRSILEDLDREVTVSEAINGRELIEKVQFQKPAAAFVDIRMPGFNGLEAIENLCGLNLPTKYIILTGHADFSYARKALQLGVIEYLLKPVNSSEMEQVLSLLRLKIESDGRTIAEQEDQRNFRDPHPEPATKSKIVVQQAEQLIREKFCDPIGVAQIAEILHITPNYLSAQFARWKEQSLTSYITNLRLEKSRELLRQPGASVKSTCQKVGYISPRHFARLFKDKYGIPPSDYICLE